VKILLKDIHYELSKGSLKNTSLTASLKYLREGIESGTEVLIACSQKKKLRARLFSSTYLGKLRTAGKTIQEGLKLITTSGVAINIDIKSKIQESIDETKKLVECTEKNTEQIKDLVLKEVIPGIDALPQLIVDLLKTKGLVADRKDCLEQFQSIAQDAELLRSEKAFCDKQMLDFALQVSTEARKDDIQHQSNTTSVSTDDLLICPISLELMEDPVLLLSSGSTFDRKSLCRSLLAHPNLDPSTNMRYDDPLSYAPNIGLRQLLMARHTDRAFCPYDDSHFEADYKGAWDRYVNSFNTDVVPENLASEYDRFMTLSEGMGRGQIDMQEAYTLVDQYDSDAVFVAIKACFLDPNNSWSVGNKDENLASYYWQKAEELGIDRCRDNPMAIYLLGSKFHLNKDYGKAVEWYRKAAEQGHALGQTNLGLMYGNGHGVAQDYGKAVEWYRKAAEQGHALGQTNLGLMYGNGHGVAQDYGKAVEWYRKAAEQGHALGQTCLVRLERSEKLNVKKKWWKWR